MKNTETDPRTEIDQTMLEWMLQFVFRGGKGEIDSYRVVEKPKPQTDEPSIFSKAEKDKIKQWLKGQD